MGVNFPYSEELTAIYGLTCWPRLKDHPNEEDAPKRHTIPEPWPIHFDQDSIDVFNQVFGSVKDSARAILEIGVDAYHGQSGVTQKASTELILEQKRYETVYVGVDLGDRSWINNANENVFTLRCNSASTDQVDEFLTSLGIDREGIDFMFIDGYHSLNQVLAEWHYIIKYLSKTGVALFHDTNFHPGPFVLFEVVDQTIFKIHKYLTDKHNFGLGEIRYR